VAAEQQPEAWDSEHGALTGSRASTLMHRRARRASVGPFNPYAAPPSGVDLEPLAAAPGSGPSAGLVFDDMDRVLHTADGWHWDAFQLAEVRGGGGGRCSGRLQAQAACHAKPLAYAGLLVRLDAAELRRPQQAAPAPRMRWPAVRIRLPSCSGLAMRHSQDLNLSCCCRRPAATRCPHWATTSSTPTTSSTASRSSPSCWRASCAASKRGARRTCHLPAASARLCSPPAQASEPPP
jgi:hypothetical protein